MADATADIKILVKDVAGALRSIDRVEKKIQTMGKASQNASRQMVAANKQTASSFDALSASVSRFSRTLAVIGTVALVATTAVREISKLQTIAIQLKAISDSSVEFAKNLELVRDVSLETGTAFKSNATLLARYTRALERTGGTANQAAIVIDTLNKAFLVNGTTGSEATSVLVQLSQALTAGALSGDEFRSFAENAGSLVDGLAETMGVTVQELKKLGSQGKITGDIVIETAIRMNEEFSKAFEDMGELPLNLQFQNLVTQMEYAVINSKVLMQSFNLLSKAVRVAFDNKVLILTTLALVNYVTIVTSLVTLYYRLRSAILLARAASLAFVASNPLLLALSLVILGVAAAWDSVTKAADDSEKATKKLERTAAITNAQFEQFLDGKMLSRLNEATVKNAELTKELDNQNKILAYHTEQIRLGHEQQSQYHGTMRRNTNERIEKLQEEIGEWKNLGEEIRALAKSRALETIAGNAFEKFAAQRKAIEEEIGKVQDKNLSNAERVEKGRAEAWKTIADNLQKAGANAERLRLAEAETFKEADKQLALMNQLDALKEKDVTRAPKKLKALKAEVDAFEQMLKSTRDNIAQLEAQLGSLSGGSSTDAASIEKELTEWKLKGASPEYISNLKTVLELQLKLSNTIQVQSEFTESLVTKQAELNASMTEGTKELLKLQNELELRRSGASEAQITTAQKLFDIEQKAREIRSSGVEDAEAVAAAWAKQQKEIVATGNAIEATAKQAAEYKAIWDALAEGSADAFISILDGSKKAGEAIRELTLDLAKMILKMLLINAIEKGFGAMGIPGFGTSTGTFGAASAGPTVRVFNYASAPGGVQTRTRDDGSVDVVLGQMAAALSQGGNSLDVALRRTYGITRQGR